MRKACVASRRPAEECERATKRGFGGQRLDELLAQPVLDDLGDQFWTQRVNKDRDTLGCTLMSVVHYSKMSILNCIEV